MQSLIYLTNIPAPYTVDFFDLLAQSYELTVLYERSASKERNSNWQTGLGSNHKSVILKGIRYGSDSSISFQVIRYLKSNYDIYVIGNYSSITGMISINYLSLAKKKFLVHADGAFVSSESFFKRFVKKSLLRKASGYFSPSNQTDRFFQFYGNTKVKIYRYPFSSIHDGDIVKSVLPLEKKRRNRNLLKLFNDEDFVILFVGSNIYRKGVDILLQAAEKINKKCGIYLIGDAPTNEQNDFLLEKNLSNVHFIPFCNHNVVLNLMQYSDLFVLPTRYDIWGLVINEALSQGLPTITTTECGAGLALIKNKYNGFLIPPNDANSISNAINSIICNDKLLEEMANNCLFTAKEYTIEKMAQAYILALNDFTQTGAK